MRTSGDCWKPHAAARRTAPAAAFPLCGTLIATRSQAASRELIHGKQGLPRRQTTLFVDRGRIERHAMSRMSINGELYRAAGELLALMHAVAYLLNEDRELLRLKPHGTRG